MNAYFHQGSIVVADERPKEVIRRLDDGVPSSTPQDSAEAKRLEARRRLLLGGAAAVPILVTVNRAKAIGFSACQSLRGKSQDPGNPAPGSPTDFGGGGQECMSGQELQELNAPDPLALDPDESVQ